MSFSLCSLPDQLSARERSVRYKRMSPDLRDESVLIRIVNEMPDRNESVPDHRLEEITRTVGDRLRPVCADMDPAEFAAMVERIAIRERRWERGGSYASHNSGRPLSQPAPR